MTLATTRYRIGGMDCAACASKIDRAVSRMPGIASVNVSVAAATMTLSHEADSDLSEVERKVKGLGYSLQALQMQTAPAAEEEAADGCGCASNDQSHSHDHDHHHHHHDHDHDHDHDHHDHQSHDGHDHAAAKAPAGLHGHDHGPSEGPWYRSAKLQLTLASGLALALAYGLGHLLPAMAPYAFAAAMLVGLVPIARRALMAALAGIPFSIEMLMTIAAIGAVLINATEEAAAVVFLFLVGEVLEGLAAGRARASIRALAQLVPKRALLAREDGSLAEVPAESLAVGAVILVRPGERISADGEVIEGESTVDQAPVTGESVPAPKRPGETVFAGTVNGEGALRLRVTAAARDNTIARVVRLVEEAQESKAPTERFIDRFSRAYTPAVVAVAFMVAVLPPLLGFGSWSEWVYKGLAILLIGCPCALVISTPAAIASALSAGARRGLLMKGGAVLESVGRIEVVALDKTGTLTRGRPDVTDILAFGTQDEREVLSLAAALEAGSSHPLALAILKKAKALALPVPPAAKARAVAGRGIAGRVGGRQVFLGSAEGVRESARLTEDELQRIAALHQEGKTLSVLLIDGEAAGAIAMRDEPRADAPTALSQLRALGIRCLMLTGDNPLAAKALAEKLGLEAEAGLLPQDKQRIVRDLRARGLSVAKLGDGINDAPALAEADVGIAMGGGTDVALETADAALLHARLADLPAMVRLSRRTMLNIRQNIAIALGLKAVFLVTTILGITGLWPAILADTGATVLVTINALRLLRLPKAA